MWRGLWVCSLLNSLSLSTSLSLSLVDADEIKRLGKRFKKLDLDNSGSLSVEEFMSLPELQQNPLVQRVIEIFDTDGNGEVDFKGGPRRSGSAPKPVTRTAFLPAGPGRTPRITNAHLQNRCGSPTASRSPLTVSV